MPLYKAYGSELVNSRTETEMVATGNMPAFEAAFEPTTRAATPFTEIGLNRPLTIEIRHLYTGEYPKAVFGFNDGLLVSSAMRSLHTFGAAPRAVNFVKGKVKKHTNLRTPHATEEGTPLIFYTPALTEKNTILTIEFIFDEFPQETLERIGNAFTSAAAIPLFAAKSTHLIAAGMLTNLVGRIGEHLFDGKPPFTVTEELNFLRPGDEAPQQGFHLMTLDGFDLAAEGCEFDQEKGELVQNANGQPYAGRHPYVIFSLDGMINAEYEQFTATAASAALLERFYNVGEGQGQVLGDLMEAVGLYNDWQFRQKADKMKAKLDAAQEGSEEKTKLQAQYDAYVANIQNQHLKPG
jgi:hypothetical protein